MARVIYVSCMIDSESRKRAFVLQVHEVARIEEYPAPKGITPPFLVALEGNTLAGYMLANCDTTKEAVNGWMRQLGL